MWKYNIYLQKYMCKIIENYVQENKIKNILHSF